MDNSIERELELLRSVYLADKTVFVDGQPGCGKTMLSPIIAALDRVEKLSYSFEVEIACQLSYLKKAEQDAVLALVRIFTDLKLYTMMMSRETNFRPSDLSSIFRDVQPLKYIKRLFQGGDEKIPGMVALQKPILHIATHSLLSISKPIFEALRERVVFIEVVRHPLYMVKQQMLNMERLISSVRYFTLHFQYKNNNIPYWALGWEEDFINANSMEKAIYYIKNITFLTDAAKKTLDNEYGGQILTIPFESFVVDPWLYMKKIEQILGTQMTKATRQTMRRQRVPRKMYAQGVGLRVYKRCGWEAPKSGSDENKEFQKRWQFAKQLASEEAMQTLDKLCIEYEKKYMGGVKKTGEGYE